jgi:7-cyano-7-deazaguanine synthase
MHKSVVVMSGGLDSVVLAYYMQKAHGFDILPLVFDYGQTNGEEIGCADRVADSLGVQIKIADVFALGELLASGLTSFNEGGMDGEYNEESMKSTFVPNRNAILLSIAYGYAISQKAYSVSYGTHGGENGKHSLTPDCTPMFRQKIEAAFFEGNSRAHESLPYVTAPFILKSKADVVRIGASLNVPFELSWSCYRNERLHCGVCGACTERKKAFASAGVVDPTEYLK